MSLSALETVFNTITKKQPKNQMTQKVLSFPKISGSFIEVLTITWKKFLV